MQFFVYFTMNPDEPMAPPQPESMAEMGQFMAESNDAGIVVATGRFPSEVTHICLTNEERVVTQGPFIESKEYIPGFTVIRVETREKAIDWASKLRSFMGNGTIRVAELPEGSYFESS